MKAFIPFALALVAVSVFAITYYSPEAVDRRAADAYHAGQLQSLERERAALQLEVDRARLEAARQLAPAQVTATALVFGLATLGALLFVAAWGGAALGRFRGERKPDKLGRLPVPVAHLGQASVAALAGFHQAQIEAARRPLPSHHYAPHITLTNHRNDSGGIPQLPSLQSADSVAVPTFSALLNDGKIGRGSGLLLGFQSSGEALYGAWRDLYSTGIGGLSGSGKSWTAANLVAQSVLHGARVVVLDPHGADEESLTARISPLAASFVCDPARDEGAMRKSVQLVLDELTRRVNGHQARTPWIVVADEFSSLQRGTLADPLARLLEALAQEGRKLNLFGLICGQSWTATRTGGTELRDSLASCYLHRLRPAQARYISGLTADDLPDDLLELPAGVAYLLDTKGDLNRLTIPRMVATDMATVGARLATSSSPDNPDGKPDGSLLVANPKQATSASQSHAVDAEAVRALALFRDGHDIASIVATLRGVRSNEGRRYQTAVTEVQALMRQALTGGLVA